MVLSMSLVMLSGCSSAPSSSSLEVNPDPRDPFQNINRKVSLFNSAVDKSVLLPVADAYGSLTPDLLKTGISNFFSNLSDVGNFANHALQFKPKKAGKDLGRLVINTTLGLGGVVDVASNIGIYQESEDFGQTLGYWGFGPGPYLVLPLLGPSTLRDTSAIFINPIPSPVSRYNPSAHRFYITALELVDIRYQLGDLDAFISGDPYIFMREAYFQRREHMINDGAPSSNDDFDDF